MPAQPFSLLLLGPLEVSLDGQPVKFRTTKAQALLIYLCAETVLHPTAAIRREALLALLWPNYPERSARQSLRTNLSYLRKAIPTLGTREGDKRAPFLLSDHRSVQTNPAVIYDLDLAKFSHLLSQSETHHHDELIACAECQDWLRQAAALYRGDFVTDFYLPDSSQFEEWVLTRRAELRRQALDALEALTAAQLARASFEEAQATARRQLEIDNLRESAHRQLMEALARSGRRRAALSQFEMMRELLEEELGIGPSADTEALVEAIQSGALSQRAEDTIPAPAARLTPTLPLPAFLEGAAEAPPPETTVFVGREQVLTQLDRHLEIALAGHGRVVFVTGEAGHGKTTLLNRFGRRAQANHSDLIVAGGNCNAYAGVGDPYLPFREVMELLTGDVQTQWAAGTLSPDHTLRLWRLLPVTAKAIVGDAPDLIDVFVSGTTLVTRAEAAMPSGAEWLQQLREVTKRKRAESTGRLEQAYLFDQYVSVLRSLSAGHPLLINLDDLQWADEGSIGLLFHLGRRLEGSRILILGGYRPEEVALGRSGKRHPLEKVLGEFKRAFGDVWLDLAEAERNEGRAFVDDLLDTEPNKLTENFRQRLFEMTGGHPLFTVELLRTMQEREDIVQDAEAGWVEGEELNWQTLPARVEGVIAERIGRLSPELHELLSVASVEGETFTAEVVAQVQGVEQRALLQKLSRELDRRHLLVRESRSVRVGQHQLSRYRFGHVLFQRYLYDDLSAGERRLLHREVARALEALYAAEPDEIAQQLAQHYLDAGEQERAVRHLRRAADRARRLFALEEAASIYRQALEHWSEADQAGRAETLRRLGECQSVTAPMGEALESFEAAFTLFEALGDREGAGAAQRLIGRARWEQARWEEAMRHFQRSLSILEQIPESVELARTVSAICRMHMLGTEYDQSIAWGERALELAGRLDAQDVTVNTLNSIGFSYYVLGQAERGLSMLQDSLRGARDLGLPEDVNRALYNMAVLLLRSCRHREARLLVDDLQANARSHHMRLNIGLSKMMYAELDWRTGQWASAARHTQSLMEVIKDVRSHDVVKVYSAYVVGGMYHDFGQAGTARKMLEKLLPMARRAMEPQTRGRYLGQLARAYAILGLETETNTVLEEFFDVIDRPSNADFASTNELLFACQWLAAQPFPGAVAAAQGCLQRLERVDVQIKSPETAVCLSEARGSVALATGDLHEAVEQLREAEARWENVGRPYDRARALHYLGQALRQTGDVDGTRAAYEQALAIVEGLAAQPVEEEMKASFLNSVLVQDIRVGLAKS